MQLTLKERIMLAHQYLILEHLVPDEAKEYSKIRHALERGFSYEYSKIAEGFIEDELSEAECKEVVDIVSMYRSLKFSYNELSDKSGIKESDVKFPGFDGNDSRESWYAAYVRYMVDEDDKWKELKAHNGDFNSHCPMLDTYKNMLAVHANFDRHSKLTKEQILAVVNAR